MNSNWVLVGLLVVGLGCGACDDSRGPAAWPERERTHEPWTRWWWMGNAVAPDTLSRLLAAYDSVGIGGVEITPIYGVKGEEDLFLEYLSPEWMRQLHHTVREAEAHDMGVDLATGTGWPFGGPHIAPNAAARRLVVKRHRLKGGERLADPLRHRSTSVDERAPLQAVMAYSADGTVRALTSRVESGGRLAWTAPAGDWTVYAVFSGWSGKRVERAAPGGSGLVIDHFSERALRQHLERIDRAFAAHGRPDVRAFFNDSYELPRANWTPDFFEAFERQQGYDLRRHLPALVDSAAAEKSTRVQADYRQTLSTLLLRNFTRPWARWAHENDARVRNQAHGSPANLLDLYAAVDVPETETFHASNFPIPGLRTDSVLAAMGEDASTPDPLLFKFASSGAHVTGKPLVSSETGTWLGEHFRVSLSQVKPEVDRLFTAGVNHVFFHGTPYSPPSARWPGWLFYASTHFAPSNTFWRDLPGLTSYIARCQSILQSGRPAHDVLLYFPIFDVWQHSEGLSGPTFQMSIHNPDAWFYGRPVHEAAQTMRDRGYTFDYVSDRLLRRLEGTEGHVQAPGGRYEVVVVPDARRMPVSTLHRLLTLAENGATIAIQGALPRDVPGWGLLEQRRHRLDSLKNSLSFSPAAAAGIESAALGRGRLLRSERLEPLLRAAGVQREPMTDRGLVFARRRHEDGHHYFVTNLGAEPVEGWISLGTTASSAVLMDPMQGRAGRAALRRTDGRAEVYMELKPGESRILRTFATRSVEAPGWPYLETGTPDTLRGPWHVTFLEGGPVRPDSFVTRRLESWTRLGGPDARRFSGTARYELSFRVASADVDDWILDLGRVRESAHVYLNGTDLGRVWAHPFRRRVGKALRPGRNRLTVEVTNLMANRIADMDRRGGRWKRFYNINVVGLDYRPFDASDWGPMPSGLLGPVTLIPTADHDPGTRP